ncbi:hypothetical protein MNBD_CHLOROFLEXI01-2404 [hydrothermal vent metagenome]|uniref:SAM-dependent methyltransferase n=1 Tax=hydrothermal vent metagenome TaxID=652676 RepID=A0A3B0W7J2_9ZZZZ
MNQARPKLPGTSALLDTTLPNLTRIFDYLVGGTANFEVDRQAAEKMLKFIPSLRKWTRLRRAFIQEAAQILHGEGFTQFLDLASGMPSNNHLHSFTPNCRIVYSDINPMAVSYGRNLFSDQSNITYIRGNGLEPETLLMAPELLKLIHRDKPVAIGLNGLPLFMSPEQTHHLAQTLYEWAPAGSKLFLVLQTHGDLTLPERYFQFLELCKKAYLPIQLSTLEDSLKMLEPWQPSLVEPITRFLGLPEEFITEADQEGIGMAFFVAILQKQKQTE